MEMDQSPHGSPYHVHPYPSPVRQQHAFQSSRTSVSPKMFHPKGFISHIDYRTYSTPSGSPILGRALCLTPKSSPIMGRISRLSDKFQDSLNLNADTEALVAKISTMFPTVSETHIKILLKKYYNREAVVISALQVEKHPITAPGPLTMSPSAARLQRSAAGQSQAGSWNGSAHLTPLETTPQGSPSLMRPASGASSNYYGSIKSQAEPTVKHSPKMKLKYLKSIFPEAEETLILDVLADKENNVQKSSEKLMTMGFHKKDTPPPPQKKAKKTTVPVKKVVTIMKTMEEKNQLKSKLETKYNTIPPRVITLALESVDYNEERAEQILAVVLQEENAPKQTKLVEFKERQSSHVVMNVTRPILKANNIVETKFKSQCSTQAKGPNLALRKGPRDCILLDNYMLWKGPNPEYRSGVQIKVKGPEQRERSSLTARGPNPNHAKGPSSTLVKGSVYKKTTRIG